jgi:holo-[acyl-carrier protein] synthase
MSMPLRTGIDIIEIRRLEEINPAIRARFIQRVYTEAEQALTHGSYPSLVGRFAAKEAVSKALGTGIGRVHWRDIEILRGPWGEPVLQLHGLAQEVADRLGLVEWSVSISHDRTHAIAVAVAQGSESPQGSPGMGPSGPPGNGTPRDENTVAQ